MKSYSIPSLIVATILGSVFLFWGAVARAQETPNVWVSPYFNFDGEFYDWCNIATFCVSLNTNNEGNGFSDWYGFVYSSSTVSTIDTIYFMANPQSTTTPASIRWEVYKTNDPYNGGTLVGVTNFMEIPYQNNISASTTKTYSAYFNNPIDIGGGYFYRFVFATQQDEDAHYYSGTGGVQNTAKYIWDLRCINSLTSECDGFLDEWTPSIWSSGTSTPAVAFAYNGAPLTGEYIATAEPCATNSNTQPTNSCNNLPSTDLTVGGFVNIETDNKKVSIYLQDKFLNNIDSVALYYTGAGYYTFDHTFSGLQASTTYNIQTCLSDALSFPEYATDPECTTIIYTNGDNPVSYEEYWCELFPTECTSTTTPQTMWNNLECDDVGITDVKKGVQCALVWAFEPSLNSRETFNKAKNAILYSVPLGYVTYIYQDVRTAFTSTSTSVFTRDIEMGKYFGRPNTATTTISLEGLTEYVSVGQPIYDLIEQIMWLMFAVWFVYWGLTRKL